MANEELRKTAELLPCPFCGGANQYVAYDFWVGHFVNCRRCGVEGPVEDSEIDAIAAWNRRAPTADLSKLRALLDSARAVPNFRRGEIEALIWEWQDTLSDFIKQQEGT